NPSIDILQMPFLYDDAAHMWRVLDGEIGDEFLASLEEADIIGLSWYDAGARSFYASKPIRSLEDLKGMRIRVQENPLMENTVRAFGAIPVPMIFSQVLSALQTGEVDAAENNLPSYESMKHYRVAPYFYRDEHFRTPEVQLMSASAWNALSEEDRDIIRECALDSAKYQRELWRAKELEAEKAVLLVGSTIESASPEDLKAFREAVSGLYNELPAKDMETIERIRSLGSHAGS
ncbi:MAG: TRAP transporter substrate-binding protein DctP, partial [Eubacteriales bacterium]|nr:TRAP transporter substrate-binding protein DctP [Eubacteriales bacterium]